MRLMFHTTSLSRLSITAPNLFKISPVICASLEKLEKLIISADAAECLASICKHGEAKPRVEASNLEACLLTPLNNDSLEIMPYANLKNINSTRNCK